MTEKQKYASAVADALERYYPDAVCSLTYEKPYELMIAGRLSAQCTDARVNVVTKELFRRYPTLESFARAGEEDVAEIIRPCGLYRTKAKSICGMARMLYFDYNGVIPDSIDELTKLPGIGRKTANLVLGDIFRKPAIVADTHCIRISNRLGLTANTKPEKVEADLRAAVAPERSSDFCHRLVLFGREFCSAPKPKCGGCPLYALCESSDKVVNC